MSTVALPVNCAVVTSLAAFIRWLDRETSPACIYYVGRNLGETLDQDARAVAFAAWNAAVKREVYLMQRRNDLGEIEYLAFRPHRGTKVPERCAPEARAGADAVAKPAAETVTSAKRVSA